MTLDVRFWGVRGSIASPGSETAKVGGNTSCVEVVCGDRESTRLILDAGTGIRSLGEQLCRSGPTRAHLLFSHYHWDHIQGLPFFLPLLRPDSQLTIHGPAPMESLREVLATQMSAPVFPLAFEHVPAQLQLGGIAPGQPLELGAARVTAAALNHPGGVLGFRIEHAGCSVVYATDTEHYEGRIDDTLLALCHQADVLIYDAMYTPAEYRGEVGPSRRGWGHSTHEAAAELAAAARVGQLVLFHHDPSRDDWGVLELEAETRRWFPNTSAAREGLTLHLEPGAPTVHAPGAFRAA